MVSQQSKGHHGDKWRIKASKEKHCTKENHTFSVALEVEKLDPNFKTLGSSVGT